MSRDKAASVTFFGTGCVFLFFATSPAPSYHCDQECRHQKDFRWGTSTTDCYHNQFYDCDRCQWGGCVNSGTPLAGSCMATGYQQFWKDGSIPAGGPLCYSPPAWCQTICIYDIDDPYDDPYEFDIWTCNQVDPTQ
jgi:hypothetical protein